MSSFYLEFDPALSSLSAPAAHLTIVQQQSTANNSHDAEACDALHAIANRMSEIESLMVKRFDQLQEHVVNMAVCVAQGVLGEEDALIQKRAQHFVREALQQLTPDVPRIVLVHPSCVDAIDQWLATNQRELIDVRPDDSVLPGDCRIETDTGGVAATLEAFLNAVAAQLASKGAAV